MAAINNTALIKNVFNIKIDIVDIDIVEKYAGVSNRVCNIITIKIK